MSAALGLLPVGLPTYLPKVLEQTEPTEPGAESVAGAHGHSLGASSLLLLREGWRGPGPRASPGFVIPQLGWVRSHQASSVTVKGPPYPLPLKKAAQCQGQCLVDAVESLSSKRNVYEMNMGRT